MLRSIQLSPLVHGSTRLSLTTATPGLGRNSISMLTAQEQQQFLQTISAAYRAQVLLAPRLEPTPRLLRSKISTVVLTNCSCSTAYFLAMKSPPFTTPAARDVASRSCLSSPLALPFRMAQAISSVCSTQVSTDRKSTRLNSSHGYI